MSTVSNASSGDSNKVWSIRFLLFIAGLGGLLYGIDVGIIAGALPYLEATSGLNSNQISFIVAAVLLGSVISTLFAGMLADAMGRKKLMILSGLLFVASIPMIALANEYQFLVFGRLLQGISAGLIGVVVPLYLAESLGAANRGKGTGLFQWLLTLGIVAAAVIGFYFSNRVKALEKLNDPEILFAFKDSAWRSIFWVSLPPGVLFVLGGFLMPESPRWLFRRNRKDAARAVLLRSRSERQADLELEEMEAAAVAEKAKTNSAGVAIKESLLSRKYVIPFLLACVILACTQATGVNSLIAYNVNIVMQAGLDDYQAHLAYVIFTSVNFLVTMLGMMLVDRKGRKFLLCIGTGGIIVSLLCIAALFRVNEKQQLECKDLLNKQIVDYTKTRLILDQKAVKDLSAADKITSITLSDSALKEATDRDGGLSLLLDKNAARTETVKDQKFTFKFNQSASDQLLTEMGDAGKTLIGKPTSLLIIYSCGDFRAATSIVRSDDESAKPIEIDHDDFLPGNKVEAFFSNPFADLAAARKAPLVIDNAIIAPIPSKANGWLTAFLSFLVMAFFAVGPGVCVWLALSELMPTRIRSNGMSIALLLNQAVSTTIAAVFLPTVGKYGYSTMFFTFAGCTVVYFITAAFFLPETKGKTLEEIEEHFSGKK